MQRYHFCEIDLAAIRHNVGVMKSHIAGGARFLAVVKADAYGHGAVPVAKAALEAAGLRVAGTSPDGRLVEVVELPEHPWYVGCQFHPEFKSRPDRPHPLFTGFVAAALEKK